ncbi:hypothetical protein HK101_009997 [Irineochytrium annulatum]|nr:hypothetical protein HK101_009997 [Irineochytrium annulatum]
MNLLAPPAVAPLYGKRRWRNFDEGEYEFFEDEQGDGRDQDSGSELTFASTSRASESPKRPGACESMSPRRPASERMSASTLRASESLSPRRPGSGSDLFLLGKRTDREGSMGSSSLGGRTDREGSMGSQFGGVPRAKRPKPSTDPHAPPLTFPSLTSGPNVPVHASTLPKTITRDPFTNHYHCPFERLSSTTTGVSACAYSSPHKHNLKLHWRQHDGERGRCHPCQVCGEAFRMPHHLTNHQRARHGIERLGGRKGNGVIDAGVRKKRRGLFEIGGEEDGIEAHAGAVGEAEVAKALVDVPMELGGAEVVKMLEAVDASPTLSVALPRLPTALPNLPIAALPTPPICRRLPTPTDDRNPSPEPLRDPSSMPEPLHLTTLPGDKRRLGCPFVFPASSSSSSSSSSTSDDPVVLSNACGFRAAVKSDLRKHWVSHLGTLKNKVACPRCGRCFDYKKNMYRHQKTSCGSKFGMKEEEATPPPEKTRRRKRSGE